MNSRRAGATEFVGEMGADRWPLAIDDAVDAGVAQRPVAPDLVLSQHPVKPCAEALDARATLAVENVRAEIDRDALQRLERMRQ